MFKLFFCLLAFFYVFTGTFCSLFAIAAFFCLLAHEMGHAAQDLDGTINDLMGDIDLVEANNLEVYETPIAKELGEPIRRHYDDWTKVMDMQNSTHFITTSVRPWWYYLFFWNWGKPSKVAIDHNVT